MYKQAVVNASPLIFLSKAGVIHFLQQAAPDIVVPEVVALKSVAEAGMTLRRGLWQTIHGWLPWRCP